MKSPNVRIPYVAKTPENIGYPKSDKLQDFLDKNSFKNPFRELGS